MKENTAKVLSYVYDDHTPKQIARDFEVGVNYILNDEGGWAERENEPGGAVNHGISFLLFTEIWKKDKKFRDTFFPGESKPTFQHLRSLSDEGAKYIYHDYVFPNVDFDHLPAGVDYVMVTVATMQGTTGAIRLLQQELDIPISGKLKDLQAAYSKLDNPAKACGGVLIYQAGLKLGDKNAGKFGRGWGVRMVRTWDRAKDMIGSKG